MRWKIFWLHFSYLFQLKGFSRHLVSKPNKWKASGVFQSIVTTNWVPFWRMAFWTEAWDFRDSGIYIYKCWMRNSNFLWGFHWKHTINNCIVNANHIVHSKLTIKCYENKSIRNLCFGTWEFPSIRSLCIFSNAPENGTRTAPAKTFPIFALITFSWENTRKKHWNKKHKFPLHFSCTKKLVSKTI